MFFNEYVFIGFIVLVVYGLEVAGHWLLFTKMGIPGWKSLIPFYNIYLRYQYTWRTKFFLACIGLAVLSGIFYAIDGSFFSTLGWICRFFAIYIDISAMFRLSKCFGKGIGYAVGLCFLPPFFMMGLGFGSAQYLGNVGNPDKLW